jgi:hypothetical protein
MTGIRHALVLSVALAVAGCSGGPPDSGEAADTGTPPADSITDRQRDSVIGASGLPGAQGVRGALEASDAAAERAAILDSLQNELP